eukprot:30850-Pelagococcus_subviridis.AAC.21
MAPPRADAASHLTPRPPPPPLPAPPIQPTRSPGVPQEDHVPHRPARQRTLFQGERRGHVAEGGVRVQRPDVRQGRRLRRRPLDARGAVPVLRGLAQVRPPSLVRRDDGQGGGGLLREVGRVGRGGPARRALRAHRPHGVAVPPRQGDSRDAVLGGHDARARPR